MRLPDFGAIQVLRWDELPAKRDHDVEIRTFVSDDLRARMVKYPAGFKADHWCRAGHVVHLLSGELTLEAQNGPSAKLVAGESCVIPSGTTPHLVRTEEGACAFVLDSPERNAGDAV